MNLFEKTSKDKRTLNIITFDAELHVHGKISQYVAEIGKFHFSGVLFLGCDGIFQNCLPKKNIDSNRNSEVCKMCKIKQLAHFNESKCGSIVLRDDETNAYLQDYFAIISEIETKEWNLAECLKLKYEEVELVRVILWEFIIHTRLLDLRIEIKDRNFFSSLILDAVKLIRNLKYHYKGIQSDAFVAIDGNYALNSIVREFITLNGGEFYSVLLHPINNFGLVKIATLPNRTIWNASVFDQIPTYTRRFSISSVWSNLRAISRRYKGLSDRVYHSPNTLIEKEVNEFINRYRDTRSFFLSSSDELTANFFSFGDYPNSLKAARSQFEVIQEIIEKSHLTSHIGYIIRAHPRQGVSQNSNRVSEEWLEIENYLASTNIPKNVLIIEPQQAISSYWIALKTNYSYVFWSTLGLELSLLGVNTVALQPEISFWGLNKFSNQPNSYAEAKKTIFLDHNYGTTNSLKLLNWINSNLGAKWIELPIIIPGTKNLFSLKFWIIRVLSKLNLTLQAFAALNFIKNKISKTLWIQKLHDIKIIIIFIKISNHIKLLIAHTILLIWAWRNKRMIIAQSAHP